MRTAGIWKPIGSTSLRPSRAPTCFRCLEPRLRRRHERPELRHRPANPPILVRLALELQCPLDRVARQSRIARDCADQLALHQPPPANLADRFLSTHNTPVLPRQPIWPSQGTGWSILDSGYPVCLVIIARRFASDGSKNQDDAGGTGLF